MDQPSLVPPKLFIRDLEDGQAVDAVFAVRERTRREKRNGDPFLKLRLGDASGVIEAVAWDSVDEIDPLCAPGEIVRVTGRFAVDPRTERTVIDAP